MNKLNVLVVGGCHSSGYLVESGQSFVDLLTFGLKQKYQVNIKIIAPISVENILEKQNEIIDFNPDIFILQIGNFEGTFSLMKYFNSPFILNVLNNVISNKVIKGAKKSSGGVVVQRTSLILKLKFILKKFIYSIVKKQLFDENYCKNNLVKLNKMLASFSSTVAIVTTAFPSIDLAIDSHRVKYNKIMRDCFDGNVYIADCYKLLKENIDNCMIDTSHLNSVGHKMISNMLLEVLSIKFKI